MSNKVTVVGAGNGGMTAAYHFAKQGHDVVLYDSPDFPAQIEAVQNNGGIKALGEVHGCSMILEGFEDDIVATTDAGVAASAAEILVMVCPSFAQEILFRQLLPHLHDGQVLLLMPGNYGGLVLDRVRREVRPELDLTFADAISIPWATRIHEPGVLTIMGIKEFLPLSIYPRVKATAEVKDLIEGTLPIPVEFLDNPIQAGLENINFGGHPLLTTLNMGLLENFGGKFTYYRDCCSTATANACAHMDKERLSVGAAYGFKLRTELEAMNALYAMDSKSVYELNRGSVTHGKIDSAPSSSKHRYITEDVPYLMVPCYELATLAGLKVPVVESCIHIASAYNDEDYFTTGRTLEKMGLGDMTVEQIDQAMEG
ncbi:MAG: NAD/NADP octopine/nopaline dehydrogenase family protein [Atopobiaceae bacterium]|jgi:opine dehydrogenase|nr:NAD/NADP octopine/nopaline dehydrogenase family protein [Atopobiaceae bacterium]MCI2172706.1 NAD/NADP octopine/nopaline dehydrogenase family protein [Atopobiaceae bacterium]MCI2207013.1 NAD/NADP octopine/nopaline dehydrogenase family protein [Atopobiaceae bacterium]